MADEHLDSAILVTLQEVMETEYPVLLDTFLLDSQERVLSLRRALASGDSEALRCAAHSFKGSCSNLGAVRLAELCFALEEMARDGRLEGAAGCVEGIEREFAIVGILFRAERQRFA